MPWRLLFPRHHPQLSDDLFGLFDVRIERIFERNSLSFDASRWSPCLLSFCAKSLAFYLRLCGGGKKISCALLPVFFRSKIIIAIGRWSLAHADGGALISVVGSNLLFHPEIILRSIVEPDIVPSVAGSAFVIPFGARS